MYTIFHDKNKSIVIFPKKEREKQGYIKESLYCKH